MLGSGRGRIFSFLESKENANDRFNCCEKRIRDNESDISSLIICKCCSTSPSKCVKDKILGRGKLLEIIPAIDIKRNCLKSCQKCDQNKQNIFPKDKTNEGDINESRNKSDSANEQKFHVGTEIKFGSTSSRISLCCNYIKLELDKKIGVYIYEVQFIPNVDSLKLRVDFLNQHRDKLNDAKIFDGTLLFLPYLLKNKMTTFISKCNRSDTEIEIRILFKKKEDLKNCIKLYNILFDKVMKALNFVRSNKKYFDPTKPKIFPLGKLEVWPGYVTSVDEFNGGLMLCCEISHRILSQKTVLEVLFEISQHSTTNFQTNAKKALLGSVVITRYNNRTYRIDDICFDQNPLSKFENSERALSYVDYYRKQYNIEIKDLEQPLLLSKKTQKKINSLNSEDLIFCLIPEICYLTGLQDNIRSDFKLMKEIASHTKINPQQRFLALEKFFHNVNNSVEAKKILSSWGLTMLRPHEKIFGQKLEMETIFFKTKSFSAGQKSNFSKYATSNELIDVINLKSWLLIHCQNDSRVAKYFLDNIERSTCLLGVRTLNPKIVILQNDRVESYVKALRMHLRKEDQIVVCICSSNRDDRYSAIKKICCSEIPIPSQVIISKTLANERKIGSIIQKIVLQMNCKIGGSLWAVQIPFEDVMVCGIDSYHDVEQKHNSVSAFVASLNGSYTKWFSKAVMQTKKEEIVGGLCSSFKAALSVYKNIHGRFPKSVIIFRDGLGDSQLNLCSTYEIPQFIAACCNEVKITFIVIQKRIKTRFYLNEGNLCANPDPGTIVDYHITRHKSYDFFLVSQSVRHGAVTPTHLIVLRDDSNYGPNIIQKLSYKLCFLYYNWPGSIRIPACCQYAHKLAQLVGQTIRKDTSEELSTKLFYL